MALINCPECSKEISDKATACPNCGCPTESTPVQHTGPTCPQCKSTNITTGDKGFSLGKAALGGVLLGPVGLMGGLSGSKNTVITCLYCGHKWSPNERPYFSLSSVSPSKPERKIYEPEKVYNLSFDTQGCIHCPVCNARLKLDSKEIEEKQFECTDCKSSIKFAVVS